METVEYLLPSHWAVALFYGDTSGMDDEEDAAFQEFVDYMVEEHGSCDAMDEVAEGFTYHHDASCYGVGGCEASRFIFAIHEKTA